ncbi:Ig-like domain-containing protein [Bermanella sp. WJH001]|uniref:Ig-like domain-containing protein n=1 Tax=Bermanella sp. WJH001 TaxID=3048005 RepID=UPI0024BE3274|nr:Ig-like domain-containing protein [Bermanella sp. WJH001]MDJ1537566.1 Ig-like domain-containing protein [Bermanella sp. WJH001]
MIRLLLVISVTLLFNAQAFAAACPSSNTATATGASFGTNCTVTDGTTGTVIQLNFENGFSDATAISAIDGNNGTTVGAQRKLSFIKAAELIAAQVDTPQTLLVDADFAALTCNASSAVLGSAGATNNLAYGSPSPAGLLDNTFYPIGLMNAILNSDADNTISDITAQFNANIGNTACLQSSNGWYYGFGTPGVNYIGFTTVLLHEITHGLGFASLTNASSGAKASTGKDDIYSNFLFSLADGANWTVAAGLSDGQRAASAVSGTGLLWNGSNVNTQAVGLLTAGFYDSGSNGGNFESGDKVQMYAPNPVEGGSSVSHFNTAASPNELMEPQYTEGQYTLGLASYLLKDIGWTINFGSNNAPVLTTTNQSTNEDTTKVVDASGWATDADGGDTLSYSVASSCATNITCSINSDGTNFTMTPAANHNGGTHTITLTVSDGTVSVSDTFNLNVIAQNDPPSWSTISAQTVNYGTPVNINLASFASDIDGDSLTYSATACGTGLTCGISSSTLTLSASSNAGATVSVTIQADDSNGGQTSTSFNVSITNTNTAPVLANIGNKAAPVNTNLTVNLSATDAEGNALTYSEVSDPSNVASITGSTLTLSKSTTGTSNVTVQVSDGSLTDSESFTFTTYAEPEIDINSTNLNPNDSLNISNSATSIDISSVNNAFSYSLEFEGSAANDLVSVNGTTLSIAMPTSGQFAGEYVLTFTDANTGTTYDFTLVRDPRLVFSATKLLANHSQQTLNIEGGAANTVYTLASSDSALSFRKNGNAITNVTADGNAASFYQASLVLVTSDVSASTAVTASVSSVFNTVNSSGLTVEPVRSHTLTFENSASDVLENVTVTLDTSALTAYNLTTTYTSNAQGQVIIALPANTVDYTATTSLSGYSNATVTLDDSLLTQTVVLEEITDPMSLSGNITALGDLSFATELPVITLVLNDGSEVDISANKSSNTLVTFNYVHNLATGSVSSLKVTHSQGIGIIFNINTTSNVTFDIFMESSTQTITNGTKKAGSSGGSLGIWALAMLLAGLTRRRSIKPRT